MTAIRVGVIGQVTRDRVTTAGRALERLGGTPVYAAAALRAAAAEPVLVVKGAPTAGAVALPSERATVSVIEHLAGGVTRQHLAEIGDGFTAVELAGMVPDLAGCRWVLLGGQSALDFPPAGLAALAAAGFLLCIDGQGLCRGSAPGPVRLHRFAAEAVAGAVAVKLNAAEAEAQETTPPLLRERLGVAELVISEGGDGATVVTPGWSDRVAGSGEPFADPTGAGDSLAALYLLERTRNLPPRQALRAAVEGVERLYRPTADAP